MSAGYSAEWKKSSEADLLKKKRKKQQIQHGLSHVYMEKSFEDKLMDK